MTKKLSEKKRAVVTQYAFERDTAQLRRVMPHVMAPLAAHETGKVQKEQRPSQLGPLRAALHSFAEACGISLL